MMKWYARILLAAYALLMFKPAMPLITDGLAHALWAHHHHEAVHKHHGHDHVHEELKKVAKEDGHERPAGKVKAGEEAAPHIAGIAISNQEPSLFWIAKAQYPSYSCRYPDVWQALEYPPPKV